MTPVVAPTPGGSPAVIASIEGSALARLRLASRVVSPADPEEAHTLLLAALADGGTSVSAAVDGEFLVGVAVSAPTNGDPRRRSLLALGVAPAARRAGLAGRLLDAHVALEPAATWEATVTVAERDWVDPLDVTLRTSIARRLLERAGFVLQPVPPPVARIDPWALQLERRGG